MAASLAYYNGDVHRPAGPWRPSASPRSSCGARSSPSRSRTRSPSWTDPSVGKVLADIINRPGAGHASLIATIIGILVALFSASSLFGELQDSLNTIWEVKPKPNRGIKGVLHDRFLTLSMVFGIIFLLLVSTVLTSVVGGVSGAVVGRFTGGAISSGVAKSILLVITFILNTGIITILFAAMFKLLPDVIVAWRRRLARCVPHVHPASKSASMD